jgi:hypothetical protein
MLSGVRRLRIAAIWLLGPALICCGSNTIRGTPLALTSAQKALARSAPSHFIVVVLENRELQEVIGSSP